MARCHHGQGQVEGNGIGASWCRINPRGEGQGDLRPCPYLRPLHADRARPRDTREVVMRLDRARPDIRADKAFFKEEHFLADEVVAESIIHPADDVGEGRRSQGRIHAPKLRGTEPPGRAARSLIGRHIRRLDKEERACDVEQRAGGELLGRGSAETHYIRQRCVTEGREAAQVTFSDKRLFGRHIGTLTTGDGRGGGQQQRDGRKVVRGGDQRIRGLVHH